MARSGFTDSNYLRRFGAESAQLVATGTVVTICYLTASAAAQTLYGLDTPTEFGTKWRYVYMSHNGADTANLLTHMSTSGGGEQVAMAMVAGSLPLWLVTASRWSASGPTSWLRSLGGTTVATANTAGTPDTMSGTLQSWIGRTAWTGEAFQGRIARVSVWDAALADAEVLAELWSLAPRRRANLVVDWRGDYDTLDLSGAGNFTLTGSLTATDNPPVPSRPPLVAGRNPYIRIVAPGSTPASVRVRMGALQEPV